MDALKEKYYKPDISEFHVGFEFEILSSHGYIKQTFPKIRETTFLRKKEDTLNRLKSMLSSVRVKYLDQEDIESLGFKFKQTNKIRNWYVLEPSFEIPGDYAVRKCTIIHDPEFKSISVVGNIGGVEETLFQGWCKNKSELKRILNMIGYEC